MRQRTVDDAGDSGGRTQIFGSKASEPETFRPVEKRNFYVSASGAPLEGDPVGILPRSLTTKTTVPGL